MEKISFRLAKYIAESINEITDKNTKEARQLGIPFDPFYYATDIIKIVDEFNKNIFIKIK